VSTTVDEDLEDSLDEPDFDPEDTVPPAAVSEAEKQKGDSLSSPDDIPATNLVSQNSTSSSGSGSSSQTEESESTEQFQSEEEANAHAIRNGSGLFCSCLGARKLTLQCKQHTDGNCCGPVGFCCPKNHFCGIDSNGKVLSKCVYRGRAIVFAPTIIIHGLPIGNNSKVHNDSYIPEGMEDDGDDDEDGIDPPVHHRPHHPKDKVVLVMHNKNAIKGHDTNSKKRAAEDSDDDDDDDDDDGDDDDYEAPEHKRRHRLRNKHLKNNKKTSSHHDDIPSSEGKKSDMDSASGDVAAKTSVSDSGVDGTTKK